MDPVSVESVRDVRRRSPLRCDGFGLGNHLRIKKRIADTAVGGPYVEREDEFSRRAVVR